MAGVDSLSIRASLQLHLVHRKVTDTDAEATSDPTGLAVVAVLFERTSGPTDKPQTHMEALTNAVRQAKTPS